MSECLVVTSRVKKFNRDNGLNTSMDAIDALSKHLESVLALSVTFARKEGRKTVMDRDVIEATTGAGL